MGSRPLVYVLRDGRERDGAWASPRCVCAGAFSLGRGSLRVSLVPIPNFPRSRFGTVEGWSECQSGLRPPWRRRAGTGMFTVSYGVGRQARRCSGSAPSRPLCCRACRRAPGRPWNLIAIAPPPPVPVARHPHPSAQLFDTSQFVETRKSTLAGVVWRTKL